MARMTEAEASALRAELAAEVVQRDTERRANPYDPSTYVWRSHDKIGNTLTEIKEIATYGYPLPKEREDSSGGMRYRGYQYEQKDGFLKGSAPWADPPVNSDIDADGPASPYEIMYLLPYDAQEMALRNVGKEEVLHKIHGKGFLLDIKPGMSKVYFMNLPGETPTIRYGANIRWIKNENLI